MDTSETYIKMCIEARDVRRDHELQEGDFYCLGGSWEAKVWCYEYMEDGIWLPRQDQLQEMVGVRTEGDLEKSGLLHGFDDGSGWCAIEGYDNRIIESYSMEQLWLAFVMWVRYQKTWNGEDWA